MNATTFKLYFFSFRSYTSLWYKFTSRLQVVILLPRSLLQAFQCSSKNLTMKRTTII